MSKKIFKICFAASSGGHFEQLLMLAPLMNKYKSFVVTEKTNYQIGKVQDRNMYYLIQINRKEKIWFLKFILNFLLSLKIFFREKPDIIVSTGVLATIPMCLICKLFKRKLIYIESFAKVTSSTLSGKLLYRYADRFYVQWESMLEVYPKAIYLGGIY